MERWQILLVVSIVILAGWIVFFAIRVARGQRAAFLDAVRSLGFISTEPSAELTRRLSDLYASLRPPGKKNTEPRYKVQNVFKKRFGEGEMFIFDLVDTSDNDNSYTERQAVAVVSGRLHTPPFALIPKPQVEGKLASVTADVINWMVKKMGQPVEFPNHPGFVQRYHVVSPQPDDTKRFLDANRLGRLAETEHLSIYAGGDILTVSAFTSNTKTATRQDLNKRVDHASTVCSIFLS